MLEQTDQMTSLGVFEKLADQMQEEIEKTTLQQFAMSEFTSKAFWGTILCLVLAAIFKKNKPFDFNDSTASNFS